MLLIWILILKISSGFCEYGIILSAENDDKAIYEGYLWNNTKIVFISPELKATIVKGVSKSEKICGFELRSQSINSIPFSVYLTNEFSGVGEMQLNPHLYLDYQSNKTFEMTVEAYDCDVLPHYSKGIPLRIHVLNESGPVFYNKSYTFSVKKSAKAKSIVGTVKAKSLYGNDIEYSIQRDEDLPFQVDQSGVISTTSSMVNVSKSEFFIRVLAKEKSKGLQKRSLAFLTIIIQPLCVNKLTDIPDQLDYHIKGEFMNMMEAGQLIQQGNRPILTICHLPSPFKEITLKISMKSDKMEQSNRDLSTKNICQTDLATARIQRGVCGANLDTIDILISEGGKINMNGNDESFGPELINGLGNDFSLSWWMKRTNTSESAIFCFNENQISVTVTIKNCVLLINHPAELLTIEIPSELCSVNRWEYFTITQNWTEFPLLKIWIRGSLISSVTTKVNLFHFDTVRFFVGHCSSKVSYRDLPLGGEDNTKAWLQVGVISLTVEKSQKQEAIECLSRCGETLLVADSITSLPKVKVQRKGSSIYLKSSNIQQLLDSPMKVHYINSFYTSRVDNFKKFERTFIGMDLSIECESKETITIPQAIMQINFIGPQKDFANDTIEVEIVSNATIIASKRNSIKIFPNLRFVNTISEKNVARDLKIESCTVRTLQRNLILNEKIYLPESWSTSLKKSKLEIRSNLNLWAIEGEAEALIYEDILKQVSVDMIDERRKFSIICHLKGGDWTNQALVEIIQLKLNNVHYAMENDLPELYHRGLSERKFFQEKNKEESVNLMNITKSKFVGIIIMAVIGGATWALVTAAITCFVLRKREKMNERKRSNIQKNYSKNFVSNSVQPSLVNNRDVFIEYEFEEDRTSMADIPNDEEQNLDNISCDTCNMTDPEVVISSSKSTKDIPRSKTITFPIIHRKF